MKSTDTKIEEWKKDWPGSMVYTSSGSVHSRGQIILLNKSFQESDFETIVEKERILGIKLSFGNLQWKIFNVYGPNKDYGPEDKTKRKDFISELYTIFNNSEKENTVVEFAVHKRKRASIENRFPLMFVQPNCELVSRNSPLNGQEARRL